MHCSLYNVPRGVGIATKRDKHLGCFIPDPTFTGEPNEEIDVGNAELRHHQKVLTHASADELRSAVQNYLSLPYAIPNAHVGWETMLLCLLSLVLDLVFPNLPCAPLMLIENGNTVPPFLATLASIHSSYPIISGNCGKIKQPSVLSAQVPLGTSAPSHDLVAYVGGKIKTSWHGKQRVWLPLCRQPVIVAPNFPSDLYDQIYKASPLAVFALVGRKAPKGHPLALRYHGRDFDGYSAMDVNVDLLRAQLAAFDEWIHDKKRRRAELLDGMTDFLPCGFRGRFSSSSSGDSLAVLLALALSTFRVFLRFCSKFGWLSDTEADASLKAAWATVLPESSPTPPSAAAVAVPPDWSNADTFWDFLAEYLSDGTSTLVGARGTSSTKAVIATSHGDELLILPREKTCTAYRSFLERAGSGSPRNDFELELVHAIIEQWGIRLQTEGRNISWRYLFYLAGQAPANCKEKVTCLGFPIKQLPESIWRLLPSDTSRSSSEESIVSKSHSEQKEKEENA